MIKLKSVSDPLQMFVLLTFVLCLRQKRNFALLFDNLVFKLICLTLDPVKPMNWRSLVILGGSRDMTRLNVPTPSWTPPSKCDLN